MRPSPPPAAHSASRGRRVVLAAGLLAVLVGALAGAGIYQVWRPLPTLQAAMTAPMSRLLGSPFALPWPAAGAATLVIPGLGLMGASGPLTPRPTASTAKVMTALLVLEDHPIAPGQPGPTLTITPADVQDYQHAVALDESSVRVAAGERLTEYQLLQGLLIPSASNFADLLARWDAGDLPTFVTKMNQRAGALGMAHTHYADASGFAPATVSVPIDLVTLAQRAMADPVFVEIVGQPAVTLPVVGALRSTDALLGQSGVVGIKTGHTVEAGGNFVFAADTRADGAFPVRIFGAVMGQPSLAAAFAVTRSLVQAMIGHLHYAMVVDRLDALGHYRAPWGAQTTVRPLGSLQLLYADGMTLHRRIEIQPGVPPIADGAVVGTLTVEIGAQQRLVSLVTAGPLPGPDLGWRLTRPL